MIREKLKKAIQACLDSLGDKFPLKSDTSKPIRLPADFGEAERHIAWMCSQIPDFFDQGKKEKADRWLGFVQGAVWALGLRTIDQMREDNREN